MVDSSMTGRTDEVGKREVDNRTAVSAPYCAGIYHVHHLLNLAGCTVVEHSLSPQELREAHRPLMC
jgi:hypothetical protein